ncbi:MAG: hypothetical protein R3F46_05500 [bacterium]
MPRLLHSLLASCLVLFCLGLGATAVHCQNSDDPPPRQEEDPPPADDPAAKGDPQQDDSGIGQLELEQPESEEDRRIKPRLRPDTDEEERAYKRQATRNDPFLNPLLPLDYERIENSGYNPRDHLLPAGYPDLSRYIVQTRGGEVRGFLTVHTSIEEQALAGRVISVVQVQEYEPRQRTEIQMQLDTLRPLQTQILPEGESRSLQALELGLEEALSAEYLFDRITIRQNVGGITGMERARMLPFSFDLNQLGTIVRCLDYESTDWPLEAVLYDPQKRANRVLSIQQPQRSTVKSAELVDYGCWELTMHVGDEIWQYSVERLEPHRIVRFSNPQMSYTLQSYTSGN